MRARGRLSAPATDFLEAFAAGMFEQADTVAGVFEFVDVGPDFGLPSLLVDRTLATGRTTGVKRNGSNLGPDLSRARQFHEDAPNLFDFLVHSKNVFVAEQVSETEFLGLKFGFDPGVEGAVLGPQLIGGIARHPESFFVRHRRFRPGPRTAC